LGHQSHATKKAFPFLFLFGGLGCDAVGGMPQNATDNNTTHGRYILRYHM
jgi:hypothetical protein